MNKIILAFIGGAGIATGIMFFLNPPVPANVASSAPYATKPQTTTSEPDTGSENSMTLSMDGMQGTMGVSATEPMHRPPQTSTLTDTGLNSQTRSDSTQASQQGGVMPSATQVEKYNSIQNTLNDAKSDSSTSLTALIQQAHELTPTQREELTQQAVEMIKRGELQPEQFTMPPES